MPTPTPRILLLCSIALGAIACSASGGNGTPAGGAGATFGPTDGGDAPFGSSEGGGFGGAGTLPDGSSAGDGIFGTGGDNPLLDGGGARECNDDEACKPGVCVAGKCCESYERACGKSCCAEGDVCIFDKCVTPGKACQGSSDCADGQYCETALGSGEASAGDAASGCAAISTAGKCVDLPPICGEGDAGADAGGCVTRCEYKPPVGALDPVIKWQWGQAIPPKAVPNKADVWATPTVGRVFDVNCDGKVDETDPPNIVFVSGDVVNTCCGCNPSGTSTCLTGVLRVLDGRNGDELFSLDKATPASVGFAGLSVALGDMNNDGTMEIFVATGEGYIAAIDSTGAVVSVSDYPFDGNTAFGWGGALALGDADNDGFPEVAFGRTMFTTKDGSIKRVFKGTAGGGGNASSDWISFFVDLDGDGDLELLAGNAAYQADGTFLWNQSATLSNGFNAVGDFDLDGKPEVVLIALPAGGGVTNGQIRVLEGATGKTLLGPVNLPGTGHGGPPTIADFDGDGSPEIGVAQQNKYTMLKPNFAGSTLDVVWSAPNHDLSSSVTGSSVFDFEGDGKAEVVYNDECFLWVYDGPTGTVRMATFTSSFTATEASIVADVDGDGHAEVVMVSNGIDTGASGWKCNIAPWNEADPANSRPAWIAPPGAPNYRGITVFGDRENSWVGTRSQWNQHAYSVTNVCDSRDSACDAPNVTGSIPKNQKANWKLPWLNNFRQNVQDKGVFDAPDPTVSLAGTCAAGSALKVSVRNVGLASLPAGVVVEIVEISGGKEKVVGTVTTTRPLLSGQTEEISFDSPSGSPSGKTYKAHIVIDPKAKTFNECSDANNVSDEVLVKCAPH